MQDDWRSLKEVKHKPLKATEKEYEEFDRMFWASVDPGYAPDDGVPSNVDHVPERNDDGSRGEGRSTTAHPVVQQELTQLEKLIAERKEKLNA
jgi:hypothetical protein